MKVLRSGSDLSYLKQGSVLTIGNFDGMHVGHQDLLSTVLAIAKKEDLRSLLVCFEPQPNEVFAQTPFPRLMTFKEKYEYASMQGFDALFCFHFNKTFSALSPQVFIESYLFPWFSPKYIVIGDDFRFGQGRRGTIELLRACAKAYDCQIIEREPLLKEGHRVSSTLIRALLSQGQMDKVIRYLGRPYAIFGRVIHGDGRARTFGVPTANLQVAHRILALSGVFVVDVVLENKQYVGVANIGYRPTVLGKEQRLEVHLFDFEGDLYGQRLQVNFWAKLRNEQKFESFNRLIEQIHEDCRQARRWWSNQTLTKKVLT